MNRNLTSALTQRRILLGNSRAEELILVEGEHDDDQDVREYNQQHLQDHLLGLVRDLAIHLRFKFPGRLQIDKMIFAKLENLAISDSVGMIMSTLLQQFESDLELTQPESTTAPSGVVHVEGNNIR